MTEFVWLTRSSRSNRIFHTDRDCTYLPEDSTRRRRKPLEEIGYSPCPFCTGEKSRGGNSPGDSGRPIYQAAVEAGRSADD